ncbi:MAG: F0F1 ATP synthase subunit A [candidate division Zixibacteria bacterium]|nr:F0F1 ATP synthase subunit A [candidate division Zixibacteria bacterium]
MIIKLLDETVKHEEETNELPNILTLIFGHHPHSAVGKFLIEYQNIFFAWVVAALISLAFYIAYRKREMIPGGLQNLLELAVEGLDAIVSGILGKEGRRYLPFLGTLFLYILLMNLFGLIPGLLSPTGGPSGVNITMALAICVFSYVQYTAITRLGPLKYAYHLMGEPKGAVGWSMVPLILPAHLVGEIAKPMSLAFRLFGNITGEDILIFAFVGLGIALTSFLPVGVPLQVPFLFLALLTSTIQALVFTLLSTVYFSLVLPHEGEEH